MPHYPDMCRRLRGDCKLHAYTKVCTYVCTLPSVYIGCSVLSADRPAVSAECASGLGCCC
jgi:hypothetical protein